MGSKLMNLSPVVNNYNNYNDTNTIEQKVTIDAQFPNVHNAAEIEEALNNLVNDAAQYASIRSN